MKSSIALILVLILTISMGVLYVRQRQIQNISNTPASTEATMTNDSPAVPKAVVLPTPEVQVPNLSSLGELLLSNISKYDGKWAIYVKDLSSGASLEIGNSKMVSASLIKIFIMAKVYSDIEAGKLQKTPEIKEKLKQMITISHNEASNDLVRIIGEGNFKLGMERVNEYSKSLGFHDTEQQRDMKDSRPVPIPEQNYTSVKDCGNLLEMIYRQNCVSSEYDKEMLNLLLDQKRRAKIPQGVPLNIKVANKTGELSDTENDIAIVFSPACDYILCIISNDVPSTSKACNNIVELSQKVYRYFNP